MAFASRASAHQPRLNTSKRKCQLDVLGAAFGHHLKLCGGTALLLPRCFCYSVGNSQFRPQIVEVFTLVSLILHTQLALARATVT